MAKYVCSICGYIYDETTGNPEHGIPPGTKWEELPDNWVCPICGATKADFKKQDDANMSTEKKQIPVTAIPTEMQQLTSLELSALCSNLARGCEKQYKPVEAALFRELADFFKSASTPSKNPNSDQLISLIEKDLNDGFPLANAIASEVKDRGALRALVWSEKVTRILKSLLIRYQQEGESMLENTNVYVCTICGFIYIGDTPPEICPVCKVPSWKFEKIEGR